MQYLQASYCQSLLRKKEMEVFIICQVHAPCGRYTRCTQFYIISFVYCNNLQLENNSVILTDKELEIRKD